MPNSYFLNPIEFIINTIVGIYIILIMVRLLLQWVRADFYNPVSQFVVKATNPPLRPLRRIIPGIGGIDVASIVLMLMLQLFSLAIILLLRGKGVPVATLFFWSVAELVSLAINVFIFAIFIQVIISWINPGAYNPVLSLLHSLTEPLLRPARRLLPPVSGFDLSPILVLLVLQVGKMLIVPPIMMLAGMG